MHASATRLRPSPMTPHMSLQSLCELYQQLNLNDMVDQLDVVVLGAPSVGKTALIEQYCRCHFIQKHRPTTSACVYTTAVVANDQLVEMNLIDIPVIPFSPLDDRAGEAGNGPGNTPTNGPSWEDLQSYAMAIGTASALIFIYDITSQESFQYIKDLREQILDCSEAEGGFDIPMIVAGNKQDLQMLSHLPRRHISQIVKKTWKCPYVECSAKYNWHVGSLFNEAIRVITMGTGNREGQTRSRRIPLRAWKQCSCSIM
ncbi:ras-like protein family member 10A [Asterias rubens]|uniref:ras-like protein family member 10A n=1 Tax=Asterias rubens TaxID=7604 RepID=UPI0014559563|nr:ras-like protein family member 10A [Asterias rubens]